MKALSFKQPWLQLMLDGVKDIENRGWQTGYRGFLLLHASKNFDWEAISSKLPWPAGMSWDKKDYQRGGFVGIATLEGIVTQSSSPWFFGLYGWQLTGIQPLEFYPFPGQLGLWDVPTEVVNQLKLARTGEYLAETLPVQLALF